jgi:hypothetical protein
LWLLRINYSSKGEIYMDKKTVSIIATVATVLCCGLPGCFSMCMGLMFALVGGIPGSDINIGGSNDPKAAIGVGIAMLCGGIIFIAIPIVVGFITLRKKPADALSAVPVVEPVAPPSEPLPPAS